MLSITTYHTTVVPPENFANGFWPLTHFGPAEVGLRQTARHYEELMRRGSTDKICVWVIPVCLHYNTIVKLPDWKSSRFLGLVYQLQKLEKLPLEECQEWRRRYTAICNQKTGRTDPASERDLSDEFAAHLRSLQYDLLQYETIAEADAYDLFSHLNLGGNGFTCYATTSLEQAKIVGQPHAIDPGDLSAAFELH